MELVHVGQSVKMNEDGHSETYRKPVLGLLDTTLKFFKVCCVLTSSITAFCRCESWSITLREKKM